MLLMKRYKRNVTQKSDEDGDSDEEIGRAGRFSYVEEIGGETEGIEDSVEDSEMSTDELLGDMNNNSRMLQSKETDKIIEENKNFRGFIFRHNITR